MTGVPLKVKDRIHHVLKHARTGDRTILGDMANDESRHPFTFGEVHQTSGAFPHLADTTRRRFKCCGKNRLDGINHQESRLQFLDPFENPFEGGLCQQIEIFSIDIQTTGTQFDLTGRLFCGYIKDRSGFCPPTGGLQ